MFIPGEVIAFLTFPGVVMHEIAHRLMCDIFKVPVYEVKYFNIGSTRAGHVIHHETNNINHTLLISLAPLFINSLLCMILTFPVSASLHIIGDGNIFDGDRIVEGVIGILGIILYWIGISMGANAFPSNQDVSNVLSMVQGKKTHVWVSIICHIIKFLNYLSAFWIDFIYAGLISFILPCLIFG